MFNVPIFIITKFAIILIIQQMQIYSYLQNKSYRDKTEKSSITQATLRRNLNCFETFNKKNWHRPMLEFKTWIFKSIQSIKSRTRKLKLITVMFLLTTLTFTWYYTKVYQIIIYWLSKQKLYYINVNQFLTLITTHFLSNHLCIKVASNQQWHRTKENILKIEV